MKQTRRLTKRQQEQATTQLHPVELAMLVEASAAPVAGAPASSDAETVEMVPLIELDVEILPPAAAGSARADAETEEIIELAKGSSELPPPIVTVRGPRRSRARMRKLGR